MLPRTLEPEVMDSDLDALDYDAMDFLETNGAFCDDLVRFARTLDGARVLDVGTGTARIPILLCAKAPGASVVGVDLASHMLAVGRANVASAGLGARITLELKDAKRTGWNDAAFDAVISNSIVHHIPEPGDALREMLRLVRPGGTVFVRDLARPERQEDVDRLVARYAGDAPGPGADAAARDRFVRQRDLYVASLHAALTVEEVRALVAPFGVAPGRVTMTSDRHWTLAWARP